LSSGEVSYRASSALLSRARPALAEIAARIRAVSRPGTVTVVGYTDDLGTTAHTAKLSRARAAAVAAALRADLTGRRITMRVKATGEMSPVVPNTTRRIGPRIGALRSSSRPDEPCQYSPRPCPSRDLEVG